MDRDFKDKFLEKLKNEDLSEEVIDSLDELIKYNKLNEENLIELINGVFDE